MEQLIAELRAHIRGDVRFDPISRALYATDASIYQIEPLGVVLPRDEQDVAATLRLARKHGVAVVDLPRLHESLAARLEAIETGADDVAALERATMAARDRFVEAAAAVSRARQRAAARLDASITAELKPLRLDKARFRTVLTPLDEGDWGEHGTERVHFEVATNPGAPFGPLAHAAP